MLKDPLQVAKDALARALDTEKRAQGLMASIGPAIVEALSPILERIISGQKQSADETRATLAGIKVAAPEIKMPDITIPEIKVPTPQVTVNIPDIKVPEAHVKVEIPEIKVPTPQVTVNVPPIKIPDLRWPEGEMPINGWVQLMGVDLKNPLPVQLRDADGRPVDFSKLGGSQVINGGGGGGGFHHVTITDIRGSTASIIDQTENALRVVGNLSIVGSASSTYAQLVDSDGNGYNSSNPLQVAGTITTTQGPVSFATDAVLSVNVIAPVNQGDAATALRVVIAGNSDTSVVVNSVLTTVPVMQVSGNTDSVFVTNPVDNGDSATALRVVVAGNSSASVSATQAGTWNVATVSAVTGITNSVAVVSLDRDGNPITGPSIAQGDAASAIRVVVAGNSDVSVTATQAGTWNIGTVSAVTGITNTVASALVDSSGVAYSGSNPLPTTASVTLSAATGQGDGASALRMIQAGDSVSSVYVNNPVDNGDSATALRVVIAGNSSSSVSVINASLAVTKSGTWAIDNPVAQGDAATALRVVIAGNSDASVTATQSGTWNIGTVSVVTGVTNSVAATLIDSSGVAYSGSNPLPVLASLSASAVQVSDGQASTITSHQDYSGDYRGLDISLLRTVNVVSPLNSSTTVLAGNATFTGLAEEVKDYSMALVSVFTDQASASDGLSVQQSSDGSNWDITDVYSIPASTGKTFSFQIAARYLRLVYTNGSTLQGSFRLMTVYHQVPVKDSSQRPGDAISNENDLTEMMAFGMGYNGATWDRLRSGPGTGVAALRVVTAVDSVASVYVNNPVDNGDSATALRVVVAGNSAASVTATQAGTWNIGTVTAVTGITNTVATALVDSSGVAYSGSNPLPTTASVTLSAATGQGDGSAALRVIQAGDSISSVYVMNPVDNGDSATALRVVIAGNSASSVTLTNATVAVTKSGTWAIDNPVDNGDAASALRVVIAGNSSASVSTVPANAFGADGLTNEVLRSGTGFFNGATWDRARNTSGEGNALRVQQATDSVSSVSATQAGSWSVSLSGALTSAVVVGSVVSDAVDDGSAPVKTGGIAHTSLPTAVSDGDSVSQSYDKLGRGLVRMQMRESLVTAYASLTNGTETTLATADAAGYLDLVYVLASNTSTAAQQVDLRAVSGGNIVVSLMVPASGTAGVSLPAPMPQDATGNAWTADLGDVTNSTVYVSALFTKEK